ncbi:MAG: FAD:protein FMN transferase, partial [bacterium]
MSQPAAISVLPENPLYKDCHHFSHHAMATVFEIYIAAEDAKYAGQAALAAFNELDLLEQELSRFIESSDISRINSLLPGQSTRVGPNAFECLQICQELYTKTGGGFDITV